MVWIATTHFGCGKARSRSGKVIVVGHYSPKGNIPEEFDENVKPSKDSFGEEDEDDDDDDEEESYTSSQERKSSNNENWWQILFARKRDWKMTYNKNQAPPHVWNLNKGAEMIPDCPDKTESAWPDYGYSARPKAQDRPLVLPRV